MPLDRLIRLFSSLKLTVVCLALATVLVFVGTLAQVTLGLYEVQARYFQSFFVFWNLPGTGIRIPVFPGGYLIGGVLLVNLAVAYTVRLGLPARTAPGCSSSMPDWCCCCWASSGPIFPSARVSCNSPRARPRATPNRNA